MSRFVDSKRHFIRVWPPLETAPLDVASLTLMARRRNDVLLFFEFPPSLPHCPARRVCTLLLCLPHCAVLPRCCLLWLALLWPASPGLLIIITLNTRSLLRLPAHTTQPTPPLPSRRQQPACRSYTEIYVVNPPNEFTH